jgi:quercetin 2,3-dioxygenase
VAGGAGFGTHPHDNMEIISIPLEGELEHRDSMGNTAAIKQNDIQIMSAGTGVSHSEYNRSKAHPVKFLQIWVFPKERNTTPRYDQITLNAEDRKNQLQQIVSPNKNDAGVWINQDAWFHLGNFDQGHSIQYALRQTGNGVYVFVLEGDILFGEQELNRRDGMGVWEISTISIQALSKSEILLMELPMN